MAASLSARGPQGALGGAELWLPRPCWTLREVIASCWDRSPGEQCLGSWQHSDLLPDDGHLRPSQHKGPPERPIRPICHFGR